MRSMPASLTGFVTFLTSVCSAQQQTSAESAAEAARRVETCRTGDIQACLGLLDLVWDGKATGWFEDAEEFLDRILALDAKGVVSQMQEPCSPVRARACVILGRLYELKDEVRSLDYYRTACEAGELRGCAWLASMLMPGGGDDLREEGRRLLDKACSGGYGPACSSIAEIFEGGDQSPESHYRQACEQKSANACLTLARMYSEGACVRRDDARAALYYSKLCEGGRKKSCFCLGRLHFYGKGVPHDVVKAVDLFHKACAAGEGLGCAWLGEFYLRGTGMPKSHASAAEFNQKACERGVAWACSRLGLAYAMGEGAIQDATRAAESYKTACDRNEPDGCFSLGELYDDGSGVPHDHEKALGLYRKACALGHTFACLRSR